MFPFDEVIMILNVLWFVLWQHEETPSKKLVSIEIVEMHAKRAFEFVMLNLFGKHKNVFAFLCYLHNEIVQI